MQQPMESFQIDRGYIIWSFNNRFFISGSFEVPEGYEREDLDKAAAISIQIAGKEGKDEVAVRDLGGFWFYQGFPFGGHGQGINISTLIFRWNQQESSFNITGELYLGGVNANTLPREATITLEIPVAPSGKAVTLFGKETISFNKVGNLWSYRSGLLGLKGVEALEAEKGTEVNGLGEMGNDMEARELWAGELMDEDFGILEGLWTDVQPHFEESFEWKDFWVDEGGYGDSTGWEDSWLDEEMYFDDSERREEQLVDESVYFDYRSTLDDQWIDFQDFEGLKKEEDLLLYKPKQLDTPSVLRDMDSMRNLRQPHKRYR